MDKISFKLNELDDVLEENIDKFSKHLDYYDTEEEMKKISTNISLL